MKIRKGFTLLLAILLVFSQFTFAAAAPLNTIDPANVSKNVQKHGEKLSKEELDELYAPTDKVRVIVEVEGEPAITYATQQGKRYSELSESTKLELQGEALSAQDAVKQQLTSNKVDMQFEHSFTTVYNGFSGLVEYRQLELIKQFDGVLDVTIATEYERPEVTPDMKYSKELVEAQATWDEYGYDGEGMIVGVIDSGVDPSHRDFVLTNEDNAALSKKEVEQLVAENGLPGKYYSAKVPYGYNYMDENDEVRDLGPGASMHGMHVSGTVGANGDEENGGLKGVAPEAQILGLKVFGNDPDMGSTYGDVYIKAIDDAIILGADVINMSLGSVAAFVEDNNPEQRAVTRATENGVLMSISAGNSAHLGNGYFNPSSSNPDIGVAGAPGVATDSLQVASLENSYMDMDGLEFNYGDVTGVAPFLSASDVHPNDIGGTYEIEFVGIGDEAGFAGKDLTGKFAFAVRGNTFTDTAFNAMDANAAGVIVYNHSDGWINMASDPAINIPQLFMSKTDGDELKAALDAGETVTVSFNGDLVSSANPLADTMSDFTSWGLTPNLDFKPEITAPGGNILSTFNDDQYGTMSGTSMAAPHVAGGSALVLQRVDEQFDLDGRERVEMAKNILMNTAAPVLDKGAANAAYDLGTYYSPRRQGAGLMQLHKAISTPVVVTEATSGLGKVALKEVGETFSFTLEATNYSDEEVTYDVEANIQSDFQVFGTLGNAYLTGELDELEGAPIDADITINGGDSTVEIAAGETVSIEVEVDLTDAKVFTVNDAGKVGYFNPNDVFPNGYFVEGYVTLTDATGDTLPQLSVPYVGFAGDWNAAPIVDALSALGPDSSFYEYSGMLYDDGQGGLSFHGYDPIADEDTMNIAISPNGDNYKDQVIPILSFLRNAKSVQYVVQDEEGKELKVLGTERNVRKHYYDGGRGAMYSVKSDFAWDGKVKNKVVADGQYYVNVKATIDYEGAEAQDYLIPVTVDTVAPELEASIDGTVISYSASDETSGVRFVEVFVNDESLGLYPGGEGEVDFGSELPKDAKVSVYAEDWAGNESEVIVSGIKDKDAPVITVDSPAAFEVYDTNDIRVSGTIQDDSEIVEFTVDGQDVELTKASRGVYTFDTVLTFEDGTHKPEFVAVDAAGNVSTLSNSRLFFVDTTAPEVSVSASPVRDNKVEVSAHIKDNNKLIRVYADDNEVFFSDWPDYEFIPFDETVTFEVELDPGQKFIEVKVTDTVGLETVKTVKVYDKAVDRFSGANRFETAVLASQEGWDSSDVVVLARYNDYADALAGAPLAAKYDAPLLLTHSNKLTASTKEEIERLGASKVVVLGGTAAVGKEVVDQLTDLGLSIDRVSGANRVETAAEVAKILAEDSEVKEAVVVDGYNFPDALSVASYAAVNGQPILLTRTNKLSSGTAKVLDELGIEKTVVVGGTAAVSDTVLVKLPYAKRVSGKNRYETAVEVAKYYGIDSNHLYVATGRQFADALSSAALAAKEGTGILLVGKNLPTEVSGYLSDNNIDAVTIVGGSAVINKDIEADLKNQLSN